jgi:hypothetical protein
MKVLHARVALPARVRWRAVIVRALDVSARCADVQGTLRLT